MNRHQIWGDDLQQHPVWINLRDAHPDALSQANHLADFARDDIPWELLTAVIPVVPLFPVGLLPIVPAWSAAQQTGLH